MGTGKVRRLKILISAYACEPCKGSEPGVGWNMAQEISKHHDVWVITRTNNREAIDTTLLFNTTPGLHFVYFDLPTWIKCLKKRNRGLHLYYYFWQLFVYRIAKNLHRKVQFDIAHHVTFVKYWAPSLLPFLPIPFVWGPVGGGESAPKSFRLDFSAQGKRYERIRDLARWIGENDPLVRITARKSRYALATTPETENRLRCIGASQVSVCSAVGISQSEIEQTDDFKSSSDSADNPFIFVSLGRLLHWKGFHISLQAFKLASIPGAVYWLVGDGNERDRLEDIAKSLGIERRLRFWGWLPRDEALEKLQQSDVVIHPSLHDSGSMVSIEAMIARKPLICFDLGGPAILVTNEAGFKIPAIQPKQAVQDLAIAMKRIVKDRTLRKKMGDAGFNHVIRELSWEKKAQTINNIYYSLVSG